MEVRSSRTRILMTFFSYCCCIWHFLRFSSLTQSFVTHFMSKRHEIFVFRITLLQNSEKLHNLWKFRIELLFSFSNFFSSLFSAQLFVSSAIENFYSLSQTFVDVVVELGRHKRQQIVFLVTLYALLLNILANFCILVNSFEFSSFFFQSRTNFTN